MHETNMEAHVSLFYEAWNRGDHQNLLQVIAPNAVDHNDETGPGGAETLLHALDTIRGAFPDLRYTIHELAIDSRRQLSVANVTCEGTFNGPFHDLAPTGALMTWREMRMARWRDGRVAEHWTTSELSAALHGIV